MHAGGRRGGRGGAPHAAAALLASPVEILDRTASPWTRSPTSAARSAACWSGWSTGGRPDAAAGHRRPRGPWSWPPAASARRSRRRPTRPGDRRRPGAGGAGRGRAARPGVCPVPPDRALAGSGERPVPADHRGPARRRRGADRRGRPAGDGGRAPARRPGPAGRGVGRDAAADGPRRRPGRTCGWTPPAWAARVETEFPTVTARCRERGIDPVTEPIPVAPGAHYSLRRDPGRPGRPDQRARPAGDRRGGQHRRARRQPSGLQLADRVADRRPARGCSSGSETASVHRRAPGASDAGAGAARPTGRPWPRPCPATPGWSATGPGWRGCWTRWPRPRPGTVN